MKKRHPFARHTEPESIAEEKAEKEPEGSAKEEAGESPAEERMEKAAGMDKPHKGRKG